MDITPTSQFPSAEEMQGRLSRLQEAMQKARIDAYVSFSPDNILYLTNFANLVHERPFILIVPQNGVPSFLVPKLEVPHVESRIIGRFDIVPYAEFPAPTARSWQTGFEKLVGGYRQVGVESVCPFYVSSAISAEVFCADLIDDQRMVKSAYELGRLAYNGTLVTAAHDRLLAEARIGTSLAEVMGKYSRQVVSQAIADNPALNMLATKFISVFHPASISHDPHNFSDIDMTMERGGPHVSVITGMLNGYGAEVERTWFLETVPDEARRPFEVMLAARRLTLELAVPGNLMSRVDQEVTALLVKEGYEDNLLHRASHGMGVTGHEAPFLADGYDRMIEPHMCFTIEPGIYIPGLGGFRHSDTIVTTETGNQFLTSGPIELDELVLGR